MDMKSNIQNYWNTINMPWGRLFYKLVWNHLDYKDKNILDFGSGFGITADFLAGNNNVTAIEHNKDMLSYRVCNNNYKQVIGSVEELKKLPDNCFDVVICHNVLEYIEDRHEVFAEFHRLLKNNGELSIVKHNKPGKVMQKAVFENNISTAIELLNNKDAVSANFGIIKEYSDNDLDNYIKNKFITRNKYGVRIFFALQKNEFKEEADWLKNMFEIETMAEQIPVFRDIAFFHHIILERLV
ncbi:MAG: class I SAM-dependent methyltransferase [Lachnospiraceae bacterium]